MRLLRRLVVGALVIWLVAAVAGVPAARSLGREVADRGRAVGRALNPPAPTLTQTPAAGAEPQEAPSTGTPSGVRAALASVVQVLVTSCGRGESGTGFVVGRERVVTNAHVVQGASRVTVLTTSGARLAARVVHYDPVADAAVLAVPALGARPLPTAPAEAGAGSSTWVAGHPLGGPLKVVPATVIGTVGGAGSDRESYVLRTRVQPGNSGSPLLDAQGRVLGVVYATAADGDPQGYARTWPAVADEVSAGTRATAAVPAGSC